VFAAATVIVSAGTHPPNPPDPPAPDPGRRQAIILWESAEISGDQAQLRLDSRTNAAFLASLAQSKHPSPLFLDPDQESPVVSKMLTAAEAADKTLPLLFVLDFSGGAVGDVLSIDAVPDTVDGILDAIRKAGG
jgi:hypothetical protein